MLPVAVQVPDVDGVSLVATVPVTGLLDPTKAREAPAEQRTKPIKRRGLKKADRDLDFVFIEVILCFACFLSLRVRGQTF